MGHQQYLGAVGVFCAVTIFASCAAAAPAPQELLERIDRLSGLDEGDEVIPLLESISEGIAADPRSMVAPLLKKIADGRLPEKSLAVHVWALGLTKDGAAVDPLIRLYRSSPSRVVQRSCLQALATIGGARAGEILVAALDAATEQGLRFDILALLARMHHEAVLSRAGELLARDPKAYYWQSVFVFGKMGDKAVPFLLSKIADPDRNVRMNAIHILGLWLLAPEVAVPVAAAYWSEGDPEVRELMLNALQLTLSDLSAMRRFFEQVVAKERDEKLLALARGTLETLDRLAGEAEQFAQQTPQPAGSFQDAWEELYRSAGRKGDYRALSAASRPEDEGRLKALRERILERHSDEALSDYQEVNRIILRNRLARRARQP